MIAPSVATMYAPAVQTSAVPVPTSMPHVLSPLQPQAAGSQASRGNFAAGLAACGLALRALVRRQQRYSDVDFPRGGRGGGYGGGYGGRGGGGNGGMSIAELTERKRRRETDQFMAYQQRILRSGVRNRRDEEFWRREERQLFKEVHVSAGINFGKYDDIPVELSGGRGTEKPIESFQEFCEKYNAPSELVANIDRCGYKAPTPVQKYSLSAICAGSDVMVSAQTGSGKTAAFLTPVITGAMQAGNRPLQEGAAKPVSVILAPTRELCQQIAVEARRLCFRSPCRVVAIYGGADAPPQLQQLAEGVELAICTPGRLEDFIGRGVISMEDVQYLVLDEADRMLDMGFEPQIRSIIERSGMPPAGHGAESRRTMMFSATFPREMQDMAMDFLDRDYLKVTVGRVGATTDNVEQRFVDCTRGGREQKFDELLAAMRGVNQDSGKGEATKTIVFANQKNVVDDLADRLYHDGRIRARAIHGGMTQAARERSLNDLKSGRATVLVATDVAARGLDLPGIDHVVNFDLASNAEDYVHRIGRTGRIGNTGVATSLVGSQETALRGIVDNLLKQSKGGSGKQLVPDWLESLAFRYGGGGRGRSGGRGGSTFRSRSAPARFGGGDSYDRPSYGRSSGGYGKGSGKGYGKGYGKGGGKGMGW